ncbi:protein PRRC1 isoform X2 [Patella vulgata]|uniref:protein PRRC1 isoform X2 n=1 Tax=Patella vulgata TaxID=6465 RepID=UPI00217FDDDA|nr:protein PRRC1 isoform X2 [Patella vulgata]
MMEETSSDEQPEMVTREEVEQAEKEANAQSPPDGRTSFPAPKPLPSFFPNSYTTNTPSRSMQSGNSRQESASTQSESKSRVASLSSVNRKRAHMDDDSMSSTYQTSSLLSWISGNSLVSKVVEKTKSSVESVITTLDPGMKEVIRTGGDINIVVTSCKDSKLGAVREAFQQVFGLATVTGQESESGTAAQPVGYTAGLKGAEERIQHLRRSSTISDEQVSVSIEGFIVELLPDKWYEMSCIVLQDPVNHIDLQTFSQPTPIPTQYIHSAQDQTPSDYPLRWAGLSVSIGQVIEQANPHIGHVDWQRALVGVDRRESLVLALRSMAYLYSQKLPTSMIS